MARHPSLRLAELVPWTGAPWTVLSGAVVRLVHPWAHASHGRAGGSAGPGRGRSTLWGRGTGSVLFPCLLDLEGGGVTREMSGD